MANSSRVSIIIPCYNREAFIAETLECVRKINYSDWECIIVDNGSTDNSRECIQQFIRQENRFRYYYQEEPNISLARNKAISHSTGEFILPLDSDDLIHPDYVKEAVALFDDPLLTVVTCDLRYFGERNKRKKTPPFCFQEFMVNNSLHNSSFFRRVDFDKTSGYDPALKTCEDWEFWISLLRDNGSVYNIRKDYFFYRQHSGSTYKKYDENKEMEGEAYKYIYHKHRVLYDKLLLSNPVLLLKQYRKYKKEYNKLRLLTLRKPLP